MREGEEAEGREAVGVVEPILWLLEVVKVLVGLGTAPFRIGCAF